MKIWTTIDNLLLALIAITFGISVFLWPELPQIVPTHWNAAGQVDDFGPKWLNLFLIPLINLGILFLMAIIPRFDPLKKNYDEFKKEYSGLRALLVLFFTFVYGVIVYASFNTQTQAMRYIFPLGFGLLFIYIGYLMPRFKPTWFVGIRTPWTLSSETSWKKTHKLGGFLFILTGALTILGSLILPGFVFWFFIIAIMAVVLALSVYSYLVWKKE